MNKDIMLELYKLKQAADKNNSIDMAYNYTLYRTIENYINNLQQQIDKTIEYINEAIKEGDYFEDNIDTDITPASYDKYVNSKDLLSILKGENNE